jgi:hypothetical protein
MYVGLVCYFVWVHNWVGDTRGGHRLGVFKDMVLRQYWEKKG